MDKIIHKLSKGKVVQVKNSEIPNLDLDISKLTADNQKKLSKAFHSGKGIRLKLDDTEIQGTGIFGRRFDKLLKKGGVKKLTYKAADALKPVANQLMEQGIAALESNPKTAALVPFAEVGRDYVNNPSKYQGKGVSKRINNKLKKLGVKKLVNKVADEVKPVVKEIIKNQASAVKGRYAKPIAEALSNVATDALDSPSEYGLGFVRGKGFSGRGVAKGVVSENYLTMNPVDRPDMYSPILPFRPMGAKST